MYAAQRFRRFVLFCFFDYTPLWAITTKARGGGWEDQPHAALATAILGEFREEGQPGTSSVEMAELIKCLDLLWIQNRF